MVLEESLEKIGKVKLVYDSIKGLLAVAAIFVIGSIFYSMSLGTKSVRTQPVLAVVQRLHNCDTVRFGDTKRRECKAIVEYTIDGVTYTGEFDTTEQLTDGSVIQIFYNPKNPKDISYNETTAGSIASYLFMFGAVILVIIGLQYYTVDKNKMLATSSGLSTISKFFK